jgi:hypothetical protein
MTRKDFKESVDAVLVENLEETLTPAELSKISKEIVARVDIDWDPFESEDPLGVGLEGDFDGPEESDGPSHSFDEDED